MGFMKNWRVSLLFGLALLVLSAATSVPAYAQGPDATPASVASGGTTTITVTVQPTVIISVEMPDSVSLQDLAGLRVRIGGNSACRTSLLPLFQDGPPVLRFVTYL